MPVPSRASLLAVLAACALAIGACGGDESYGDKVPRSAPELTPPRGADALVPDGATTAQTDTTTSSDETTTTTTPSAGAGSGAASGGTQTAPAQPQPSPGATGGAAATPQQQQQQQQQQQSPGTTGGAGTGGTSPGEFSQFCRDNPGACPGN